MPNPLRIPTWLLGLTAVVIPGASIRVLVSRNFEGTTGLVQILLPLVIFGYGLVTVDRLEARGQLGASFWPGSKYRRTIFLSLLTVTDIYCALILFVGGRFIAGFGI